MRVVLLEHAVKVLEASECVRQTMTAYVLD